MRNLATAVATVCAMAAFTPTPSHAVAVDAELLLMIDVSGSVSALEYDGQRNGYVAAFQSATVQSAIAATANGIAVSIVQWSGATEQVQSIGWTHLTNAAEANAFATLVFAMPRAFAGLTAIGSALDFGKTLFGTETGGVANGFESLRQVIDVSGDGATNNGIASSAGRDAALAAGVDVINGIAILGEGGLLTHYQSQVIGGTNNDGSPAFAIGVTNFTTDFAQAITQKLAAETTGTGIPEPMSLALFGAGLLGVGALRRRRTA